MKEIKKISSISKLHPSVSSFKFTNWHKLIVPKLRGKALIQLCLSPTHHSFESTWKAKVSVTGQMLALIERREGGNLPTPQDSLPIKVIV